MPYRAILLDLSKAFDKVHQLGLTEKRKNGKLSDTMYYQVD